MSKIPLIISKVEQSIEGITHEEVFPRPYLGMSMLGHSCNRYLWYYFHWAFKERFSPRVLRIFERGLLEEPRVIRDLVAAGMTVEGEQTTIKFNSYIEGHCDGIVCNVPDSPNKPHLLEVKTMKDASFKALKKDGVQKANYGYYCQCIVYMYFLGLKRALFICTNKDTEERYYERIKADSDWAEFLIDKASDITQAEYPPRKLSEDPAWFECKYCSAREVCHEKSNPPISCRTCEYSTAIHTEGEGWYCRKHEIYLNEQSQKDACPQYSLSSAISEGSDRSSLGLLPKGE